MFLSAAFSRSAGFKLSSLTVFAKVLPSAVAIGCRGSFARPALLRVLNELLGKKTLGESLPSRSEAVHKSPSQPEIFAELSKPNPDIKRAISENIYTIPNMLTFTRLISAPAVGYLIMTEQRWAAIGLFTYSCVTDFVDGYIARKFNMGSVLGSIMDPMADKMLMMLCTLSLASVDQIPAYVAALILGRDAILGLAFVVIRYVSLPTPKTFARYWDFSLPTASVHPTKISKYNTFFQMVYIGTCVMKPAVLHVLSSEYVAAFDTGMDGFGVFVASTTVLSGLSYVFSKDTVRFIK
ncbi:hypothetical protein BABINDRAFT_161542 [Babjeviella inositovora NRRL Y-12698]|uniref:CDP-diacylglycerol--glycerol-3-phosphate 3-phosphatidyltransferase n=1 Tax=Babjeviella inositovora NRRL Y-12698 TaxID=984486 RepID=A0A1E3QQT9_9ASCO|nr:uncharacterized protein BABINDRAFT_161542 [Babjeviella inositovora NRRL Y-12698]ODQ79864.1 hypothetical protein BABINDRAFT_161542 [Babjeviella inositovora NRRL Y-12698]